uniref:Uncharacterized protein n=1 Tax=Glossina pallidipes TaxID=7398 RepID=A0A1A9Z3I4_GLOPL
MTRRHETHWDLAYQTSSLLDFWLFSEGALLKYSNQHWMCSWSLCDSCGQKKVIPCDTNLRGRRIVRSNRQCALEIMHTRLFNLLDLRMIGKFIAVIGIGPRKLFEKKEENILPQYLQEPLYYVEGVKDRLGHIKENDSLFRFGADEILSAAPKLVSPAQYAFHREHNTTNLLLNLTETIRSNINDFRTTSLPASELPKASNNFNHWGVIIKLGGQFGFSKSAWIANCEIPICSHQWCLFEFRLVHGLLMRHVLYGLEVVAGTKAGIFLRFSRFMNSIVRYVCDTRGREHLSDVVTDPLWLGDILLNATTIEHSSDYYKSRLLNLLYMAGEPSCKILTERPKMTYDMIAKFLSVVEKVMVLIAIFKIAKETKVGQENTVKRKSLLQPYFALLSQSSRF